MAITIADSKVTISSGSGGKNKAVISYADLKEAYDGADYSGKTKADLTDFAVHYASNGGTIEKDGQGAGALSPEITTASPPPADTLTVTFDNNADTVTIDGIDTDVVAADLQFKVVDSDGVGAPSVAITIADPRLLFRLVRAVKIKLLFRMQI